MKDECASYGADEVEMDVYEPSDSKEDDVEERPVIQETLNEVDAVSTEMQVECASYRGDGVEMDVYGPSPSKEDDVEERS